jgi:hypothetical protein
VHGSEIFLNRCPKRDALARTPKAQQCHKCLYDWHIKSTGGTST